ncbi:MAG: hypothetical protein GY870_13815, partial [archaeon]|nr:hypothetical protein [archaeon]
KIFIFKFEEYSKEIEGLYLIAEAEIFDSLGRLSTTKTEGILGKNKNEWARLRRSGYIQDMFPKAGWFAHVVAANKAQFDYSIDTMIKIAEKTGATIIDPDSDPNFVSRNPTIIKPIKSLTPKEYDTPEKILSLQQTLFQFLVIKNFTLKTCVMPMAGTNGPLPAFGYSTIDKLIGFMQDYQLPIKAKYQKMGKFLDDGPDGNWSTLDEGGHIMVYMNFTRNEPLDPNSEHLGLLLETFSKAVQEGFPPLRGMPPAEKSMIWSKYLTKIEDSLDPNNTRDRFWQDDLAMWLYKDHVEDTEKKQAKNTVGGL